MFPFLFQKRAGAPAGQDGDTCAPMAVPLCFSISRRRRALEEAPGGSRGRELSGVPGAAGRGTLGVYACRADGRLIGLTGGRKTVLQDGSGRAMSALWRVWSALGTPDRPAERALSAAEQR